MIIKRLIAFILLASIISGCISQGTPGGSTTAIEEHGFPDLPPIAITPVEAVEVPAVEPNPNPTPSPLQLTLNQEFRAPYPGIFFSNDQAAYVIAELEAYQDRVATTMNSVRRTFQARLDREIEDLRIQINGDRTRFRIAIEARDAEINRLLRLNERFVNRGSEFPWEAVLTGAGGLLIGVVGGFIMGFLAVN